MKNMVIIGSVCILLCVLSGTVGAYSVVILEARKAEQKTLQVHRLELMDDKKHVRASFAVEDDGSVVLRMLSTNDVPVIELGSSGDREGKRGNYSPSGNLIIRDGFRTPVIQLGTFREGEGTLFFSSRKTSGQVAVGYQPYGDAIDGLDRGVWGIQIKGPNHENTGVGVYTEDDVAHKFLGPQKDGSGK